MSRNYLYSLPLVLLALVCGSVGAHAEFQFGTWGIDPWTQAVVASGCNLSIRTGNVTNATDTFLDWCTQADLSYVCTPLEPAQITPLGLHEVKAITGTPFSSGGICFHMPRIHLHD